MNSNQRRFSFSSRALAALGAWLLLASLAQAANTVWVTYDLRATGVTGTGITIENAKSVKLDPQAIGTVNLQLWAQINKLNGTDHADDGMAVTEGSFKSTSTALKGNFSSNVLGAGFSGLGSQVGIAQDLDGDGDLDWGSANPGPLVQSAPFSTVAYFTTIGTTVFSQQGAGTGVSEVLMGTINWSPTGGLVVGNATDLNFGTLLRTDGTTPAKRTTQVRINGTLYAIGVPGIGTLSCTTPNGTQVSSIADPLLASGLPVNLHVVPEPGSLALLGLGMVGVVGLARRRRTA